MTLLGVVKLVAGISLLLWAFLNVNAQLERLNRNSFERSRSEVNRRLSEASGFYRVLGLTLYAPYTHPVKATLIWLLAVALLFFW